MLDDLREDADFMEEDDDYQDFTPAAGPETQFLGMTPVQRFVIALMIFMMICILGSFFLLITETVWLPF
jgi:hypothetical protein